MARVNTTCGIYKIENNLDGKIYIGSSHRIEDRFYGHKWELERQEHHSVLLQRAVNKHGIDNFTFSKILICSKDDLMFYEQLILDAYKSYEPKNGYNICKIADSPPIVEFSAERRKQMSEQRKGKQIYKNNPERYAKLLERAALRRGDNHHFTNGKMSDELKLKMSLNFTRRDGMKGKENTWTPKQRSKETIEKIKATKRSKPCPYAKITEEQVREIRKMYEDGNISYQKIGELYGLNRSSVGLIVKRINWPNVV